MYACMHILFIDLFFSAIQRQEYNHGGTKKWKGRSDPVNINFRCQTGKNRIILTCKEIKPYILVLQIVRNKEMEEVYEVITVIQYIFRGDDS